MSGWMWVWASRLGSGMRWLPCACVPGPRAGWWASEVNQVWCSPPVLLQIALPANHTVIIPSCPKCCPCLSAAEVPRSSICCTVKSWDKGDPFRVSQTGGPRIPSITVTWLESVVEFGDFRDYSWTRPQVGSWQSASYTNSPGGFFFVLKFGNHPITRTHCTRKPRACLFWHPPGKIYPKKKTNVAPFPGKHSCVCKEVSWLSGSLGTPTGVCATFPVGITECLALNFVSSRTEFASAVYFVFHFCNWCTILQFTGILVSLTFHHRNPHHLVVSSAEQTCVYSICMEHRRIDS